jgi:hypothetical protein
VRALPWVAATVLAAAGALALHELRAASATPVVIAPAPRAQPPSSPETPPAVPVQPVADARPQIRRAVEAAAPTLRTPHDVERYLGELEDRARHNRRLTALEVEPGLAAIRSLGAEGDPQRVREMEGEFLRKMNRLAAELGTNDG